VYLIDRRDALLTNDIHNLEKELTQINKISVQPVDKGFSYPLQPIKTKHHKTSKTNLMEMNLCRGKGKSRYPADQNGVWISGQRYSIAHSKSDWLWIDPLLFPEEEIVCADTIRRAVRKGAKNFVLNAPWQIALFQDPGHLNIWAGPFCNITNSMTIHCLEEMGFSGVIVSPELDKQTFLALPSKSCLPLGAVIYGNWPLGISRIISLDLKIGEPFSSPMGETAWVSKFNDNYHIFPNWLLDLTQLKEELKRAGYSLFVNIHETIPQTVLIKKRPGLWNWNLNLI
ncbi:MAG: U32 family peptidase, partial [Pseudomonadota bacterium]